MSCKRCPHHVRHGLPSKNGKTVEFTEKCSLMMEQAQDCVNFPFPKVFDYMGCNIYQQVFKTTISRNDVIPTRDFQYSDNISNKTLTDMDLL